MRTIALFVVFGLTLCAAAQTLQTPKSPFPFAKPPRGGNQGLTGPTKPLEEAPGGVVTSSVRRYALVERDLSAAPPAEEVALTTATPPVAAAQSLAGMQVAFGPAQVGGVSLPAVSLHPQGIDVATQTYPAVAIRTIADRWPRAMLLLKLGLADPIAAPAPDEPEPSPIGLTVLVNDRVVYNTQVAGRAWLDRAIDLTEFAGQTVALTFKATGTKVDETRSTLCLGQPLLVEEQGPYYVVQGGRGSAFGFTMPSYAKASSTLALINVKCESGSTFGLSIGNATADVKLEAGNHWVPLEFVAGDHFSFKPVEGDAKVLRIDFAPFTRPPSEGLGPMSPTPSVGAVATP